MILQKSLYADLFKKQLLLLLLLILFKTVEYIFVRILWWIERSNDQHLCEIHSFCNIIHYTIQKLGVSIICIFGEFLFSKDALNRSKMMIKTEKKPEKNYTQLFSTK